MNPALPNPFMAIQAQHDWSPLLAQIEALASRMIAEIADTVASLRETNWERAARYRRQNLAIIERFEELDRTHSLPATLPIFLNALL